MSRQIMPSKMPAVLNIPQNSELEDYITSQMLTLEELKQQSIEKVFMDVVNQQMIFIIRLPGGNEVFIEPKSQLKPLPVLKGYVPEGWKDAIYSHN